MRKFTFLNVYLNALNIDGAFEQLSSKNNADDSKYILFPDLYVLLSAQKDSKLLDTINNAYMALPDGKPSELVARFKGLKEVRTISGYRLLLKLLQDTQNRHFFYGSTEEKLSSIAQSLKYYDPNNEKILGFKSAPFIDLSEIEHSEQIKSDFEEISKLSPDYIWIGLSSPKQDYLIYHHHKLLKGGYLLGVGGVFDYLSGSVSISPEWIKKMGLRWLYRLVREPRRLFPKYLSIFKNLIHLLIRKLKNS